MIKINDNILIWKENERRIAFNLILNMISLIIIISLLLLSTIYIDIQLNGNNNTIILNFFLQVLLIIIGFILRNKFLKPDFRRAYNLAIHYHQFKGTIPNYRKRGYQILGSILGILLLPIVSAIIFYNIANIEGVGVFFVSFLYYPSIILGILVHPNTVLDNGSINNVKISINQSDGGNYFSLDLPIQHIDQIGIYLEPKFLFIPEKITMTISLQEDYYYTVSLDPNEPESSINQIDKIHEWFENTLGIKSIIHESYDEWKNEWKDKLEVKMWV